MSEEVLCAIVLSGFGLIVLTVVILTSIYHFKELAYRERRDLKAIETLKSNVELKLNSNDLKELFK